jgi:hypothetical protein
MTAFATRPPTERDRDPLYALHCVTMRAVLDRTWGWDEARQAAEFDRRFGQHRVSVIEAEPPFVRLRRDTRPRPSA